MSSKILFFLFIIVLAITSIPSVNALNVTIGDITINGTDTYYDANFSSVSIPTNIVPITNLFISNQDTGYQKDLSSISIPTNKVPITNLFISNQDAPYQKDLSSVSIPTNSVPITDLFISNQDTDAQKDLSSVSIPTNSVPITNIFISNADDIFKENLENLVSNQTTQPPIASFTYSPKNPIANQTIIFDASNSTDPDGTITNYEWNFGEGTTGFGKLTTHSYAENGTYTVKLTVTDGKEATNATLKKITIGTICVEEEYNPKVSIPACAPYWINSYLGNTFTYIIKVQNSGRKRDTINLRVKPKYNEGYVNYQLSESSITLAPSESKFVNLCVTPTKITPEINGWNQITINATSQENRNNSKMSSRYVYYETPSDRIYYQPLSFVLNFNNLEEHNLSFTASDNVKVGKIQSDGICCIFDLNSSQTSSREFYVEVTDKTAGETVKIPMELSSNFSIIATDFDVSEDGYSFENYASYDYSWPLPIWKKEHPNCYGMSETSILYYSGVLELPNNAKNTYSLERTPEVEERIKAHQNREENSVNDSMFRDANETREYNWGIKWWVDFSKQPTMLLMSSSTQGSENSHSVVVYKVVEDEDEVYIYIYDPNAPYNATNLLDSYKYGIYNKTTHEFLYEGGIKEDEVITFVKFVVRVATLLSSDEIVSTGLCPVNTTITKQYNTIILGNNSGHAVFTKASTLNPSK